MSINSRLVRLAAVLVALLSPAIASAQSQPNWSYGYVPTAGEIRGAFGAKQDRLSYTPLNQAGGTMSGKLQTAPSTINGAGFSFLPGIAPTSPNNGDVWATNIGFFGRIGDQTVSIGATGTMAGQNANAVSITGGAINGTTIGTTAPSTGAFTTLSAATPIAGSSGGTGYSSVSAALDGLFSSTQGAILYRGAAGWQGLGPGTSGQFLTTSGSGANPAWTTPATVIVITPPQGRLTLTSGVPVLTATVNAATSVLYTPSQGNLIPLWNGSSDVMTAFAEVSQALADTTKSPAAAAAGNVYDLFAWNDAGTVRVTRGPAWTAGATPGSNVARGAGAGSTALSRVNGLLRNAVAITNGPAAGFGTWVGTIVTDASGATVSFNPGSAAANGGAAWIGLWNAFDRKPVALNVQDTNVSHTYASATLRAYAGSTTWRATVVRGLDVDGVTASMMSQASNTGGVSYLNIGLDSTTAGAASAMTGLESNVNATTFSRYAGLPGAGLHFLQALEATDNSSSTSTFVNNRAQLDVLTTF